MRDRAVYAVCLGALLLGVLGWGCDGFLGACFVLAFVWSFKVEGWRYWCPTIDAWLERRRKRRTLGLQLEQEEQLRLKMEKKRLKEEEAHLLAKGGDEDEDK